MAVARIRHKSDSLAGSGKNRNKPPAPKTPSQWGNFKAGSKKQITQNRVNKKSGDKRWQREMKEMQETHDLDEVDDDVEKAATLYEWRAIEHEHRPKSPVWFAVLAAATTVLVGIMLFFFTNVFGAVTITLVGGLIYYIAQQKPATVRYRIMLDGIALNNIIYHWDDLAAFNIIYEPDETKTAIFRSNRRFSPYIHMEVGDADPVEIREILMEFVAEDQEIQEPIADIIARRLGF